MNSQEYRPPTVKEAVDYLNRMKSDEITRDSLEYWREMCGDAFVMKVRAELNKS